LPVGELLDHLLTKVATPLTEQEANGLAVVKKQVCITCHLPNLATATVGGPDLTTAIERLGETKVRAVLANGVPGTVMPKFGFSDRQLDEVVAYLAWLGRHRDEAQRVFEVTRPGDGWSLRDVPWFEYD
jgi:mono/diheme cytochrome c family protein